MMTPEDNDKDFSKERQVEEGGRTFLVKPVDPFGFWYISLPKGKTPNDLNGAYTSLLEAEKAIKNYVDNIRKD